MAQIANPASAYCVQHQGILEIVDTEEGQVGMCELQSGKVCEEWAYFRGECEE
jgi:putative hemolysin